MVVKCREVQADALSQLAPVTRFVSNHYFTWKSGIAGQ